MSISKAQQSRINGAKSGGPKTLEGKARSSMNAVKHGRYASNAIVLSNEDPAAFEALVVDYVQRIRPADPVEYNFVRELASIDWRLARVRALDTRLLDHEMELQALALETSGHHLSELTRLLHASRSVVDRSRYPAFLARRESQLLQARLLTFRGLRALRKDAPLADPALQIIPPMPIDPDSIFRNEPETNLASILPSPAARTEASTENTPRTISDAALPDDPGFPAVASVQSRPQVTREPSTQPQPLTSTRTILKPDRDPSPNSRRHSTPLRSAPAFAPRPGPLDPVQLPVAPRGSSELGHSPAPSEKAA